MEDSCPGRRRGKERHSQHCPGSVQHKFSLTPMKYMEGAAPQISQERGSPESKEEQFHVLLSYCHYISSFVLLMTNKMQVLNGSEEIWAEIKSGMLRFDTRAGS